MVSNEICCKECKKFFIPNRYFKKYCSTICYQNFYGRDPKKSKSVSKSRIKGNCSNCNTQTFVAYFNKKLYCLGCFYKEKANFMKSFKKLERGKIEND
jgi:hypothetical protein